MAKRTAKGAVTFRRRFGLGAFGEQPPGGRHPAQTDEELVKGLSLLDYQRRATARFEADPLTRGQIEAALPEDPVQPLILDVVPPKAES